MPAKKNTFGESKPEFKSRLEKEGRWQQFVNQRERNKKDTSIDLNTAIDLATALFPPKGDSGEDAWFAPKISGKEWDTKPASNMRDDYEWVFQNIRNNSAIPKDSPSRGAWDMYSYYRENPVAVADYYLTIAPKLMPTKAQLDKDQKRTDDGRKVFQYIDESIKAAAEAEDEAASKYHEVHAEGNALAN